MKRPDFIEIVDRLICKIARLERRRMLLIRSCAANADPHEFPEQVQNILEEMDATGAPRI